MFRKGTIVILFVIICNDPQAQTLDLTQIGKGKSLKINGGLTANSVYYNSWGQTLSNRDPFTYYLTGNLVFSLYSYSMPLSFSYSNQNFDYQHSFSFNRFSIHPTYKWITAHIGDVAMSFSPYTLNGHQFAGFGVDLAPPGNFKVSIMYGRLLQAVKPQEDTNVIPSYKRNGYGVKVDWHKKKSSLGVIVFHAKDDVNSLMVMPQQSGVLPRENLVISLDGGINFLKYFQLSAEYAISGISNDIRAEREQLCLLVYASQKFHTIFQGAKNFISGNKRGYQYRCGVRAN